MKILVEAGLPPELYHLVNEKIDGDDSLTWDRVFVQALSAWCLRNRLLWDKDLPRLP